MSAFTAWIYRGVPSPDAEYRALHCTALERAERFLEMALDQWPEATEYGIDRESSSGTETVFLSAALTEQIEADWCAAAKGRQTAG